MRLFCNEKCNKRPVGTNICTCDPNHRPANCPLNKDKNKSNNKQ